jgi:two-component system, OmpR family, sensor histidine kinase BaeS
MRSLRARLILSHIIPILIIIPLVGVVLVYLLETQVLLGNVSNELIRQAVLVADVAGSYSEIWFSPARAQLFVNQISPQVTARVMLLDPVGRLMVSSDAGDAAQVGKVFDQEYIQRVQNGETTDVQVTHNQSEISDVIVPVITGDGRLLGFVRLVNPLLDVFTRSQTLRKISLLVLGVGVLLGLLLGWRLATEIEHPIRTVTHALPQLARGGELTPIPEQGPEEIRLLVRSVNALVERLRTLEEGRRRLLANLVHELGTPLGALRSGVQALLGGADEDVNLRKELLSGMDLELGSLQGLLDELAHLHDQVLGPLELNAHPVDLNEWINTFSGPWREAAQEKGLHWETEIAEQLPVVSIDPDRLSQALGNLVSNAIRYTPADGTIWIRANTQPGTVQIQVTDTGPGMTEEEQHQIFSPLYRGKAARRFSQGMGLGLTIARDLVQAHGGKLIVESKPGHGSTFSIQIPLE